MKNKHVTWLLLLVIVLLSGCNGDSGTNPKEEIYPTTNFTLRTVRSNEFAVDLYKKVRETEENLILSPHSTSVAFAMLYAGARENTEIEISDVLRFHYPQANGFHSSMALLNDQICSRGESNSDEFNIWMANGCWVDRSYPVLQSYQDTLMYYYNTEIDTVDFSNNPDQARTIINDWVYDKTDEKIQDIFPEGTITRLTQFVLSNVFCYEAEWLQCFDPEYTMNRDFTLLDGTTKTVLFMEGEDGFRFFDGDGYRALRVPYKGNDVSMIIFLPDEGNYSAFEDSLSGEFITSIYDSLGFASVCVYLPRFHITTELQLGNVLQSMGMVSAFGPGADFSGMDGIDDGEPYILRVQNKTMMYFNEYGTSFFSATAISGGTIGIHSSFCANRPFIFAVIDEPTGVILFIGRVLNPNGYFWPYLY